MISDIDPIETDRTTLDPSEGPPDWERIAFTVRCGRCGFDLRGQSHPQCPACDLRFDWGSLLPIDDLRCLKCNYRLYGSTQQRCPECGERFDWETILNAARARKSRLFEHRWFDAPLSSLLRTWWLAVFRPFKLWSLHDINDSPRLGPLIAFMLLQWSVFAGGWFAVASAADVGMNGLAQWLGNGKRFTYQFRMPSDFLRDSATWYVATFLSFQVFILTKRRFQVRWQQILRVYIHATAFCTFGMTLAAISEVAVDLCIMFDVLQRVRITLYNRIQWGILWFGLVVTWAYIWIGYRQYLKVPRGWGTSAMCLLLGYLLAQLLP